MKKNILVTGAAGFVGRALTKRLLAAGHRIILSAKDENFRCDGAEVYYGDLSDGNFCGKILKNVDVVYYLAGYKRNMKHHVEKPFDFILGNVHPLLNFMRAAGASGVKRIIYLSSALVDYAFQKDGPVDGYAIGKYINELVLRSFSVQFGVDVKIIRSVPVYGPGDNFHPETANLIPALIDRAYRAKKNVIMWGRGTRILQFIYIDDLVENLLAVDKDAGSEYIFGNPEKISVRDVLLKIIGLLKKRLVIESDLSKPDRSTKLFKFNNLVKPEYSIDKGLARAVEFYLQNQCR